MTKKLVLTAMVLLGLAGMVGVGTHALFVDSPIVDGNLFATGKIDLSTDVTTALVSFSNMLPGEVVTAPVEVTNAGTSELRYAISSAATPGGTPALEDTLVLTVRDVDADAAVPCDAFDGTLLYSGDLDSTDGKLVGDSATGYDVRAGFNADRILAAEADEFLCFRVELPIGVTGPTSASTTATFTFSAEQTLHN